MKRGEVTAEITKRKISGLTDGFEGREQIEDPEAALMERLEVESANREAERAVRLEPMIDLWDKA